MSLEEAHLILNTKKTDNMETIMAVSTGFCSVGAVASWPRLWLARFAVLQ